MTHGIQLFKERCGVRWGTHRLAIMLGPWAIKVPVLTEWRLMLYGLLANLRERQWTAVALPDDRIAPVLLSFPGGWLNVMPRCRPLTRSEFDLVDANQWRDFGNVEDKMDSFGVLRGRVVAVDYG